MIRLTNVINQSNSRTITTTATSRSKARYISWETLFQTNEHLNRTLFKTFGSPANLTEYSHWVKRQKRVCS
jgi:hypothetical protein